jgi:coenzyme Q-binding protein COQ10
MPTHAESRIVPYRAEQIFDLVADVGKYPQFLPWCAASRVKSRTPAEEVADLTIAFGPFRETFTSRVALDRPHVVRVSYEQGPFRYLNNQWKFTPDPRGCRVDFFVDFEFRNRLLQSAIGVVFNQAVRRMVDAFLKRAGELYGPSHAHSSAAAHTPAAHVAAAPKPAAPAAPAAGAVTAAAVLPAAAVPATAVPAAPPHARST